MRLLRAPAIFLIPSLAAAAAEPYSLRCTELGFNGVHPAVGYTLLATFEPGKSVIRARVTRGGRTVFPLGPMLAERWQAEAEASRGRLGLRFDGAGDQWLSLSNFSNRQGDGPGSTPLSRDFANAWAFNGTLSARILLAGDVVLHSGPIQMSCILQGPADDFSIDLPAYRPLQPEIPSYGEVCFEALRVR